MLNLYFTFNILFRLAFYKQLNVVNLDWDFVGVGLVGLLAGTLAGGFVAKKLSVDLYRLGVSYGVLILGFVLIVLAEAGL